MNTSSSPIAFSIADAAVAAGLPEAKLRRAIADGHLTARAAGPHLVILSSDLAQWLASLPRLQPADPEAERAAKAKTDAAKRERGRQLATKLMPALGKKGATR